MAEIGKVTPGAPIVTRHPHDRTAADGEKQQETEEQKRENQKRDEEENHKPDYEGGVDLYV